MKYIVKAESSAWEYDTDVEVDTFLEWLQETKDEFFLDEEDSEYFTYVEEKTIDSYVDHKRGYEIRRIVIQENGTENYYGVTKTLYNFGEYEFGGWSRLEKVPVTTFEWKEVA